MIRCYHELKNIKSFEERYEYLKLNGIVGESTFGYDRYINQLLYRSDEWKDTRAGIIIRDKACDLGINGYEIHDKILVHHMIPITADDILQNRDIVFDPENLICTTLKTHNAIHFGDKSLLPQLPIQRKRNDTCPWR
jgi:hypothetical protein